MIEQCESTAIEIEREKEAAKQFNKTNIVRVTLSSGVEFNQHRER